MPDLKPISVGSNPDGAYYFNDTGIYSRLNKFQWFVWLFFKTEVPGPPNQPSVISLSVGDRFMTVVWTYTDDIHSLIRNFTIQYRMNNNSQLNTVDAFIPPDATEYTVTRYLFSVPSLGKKLLWFT